MNWPLALAIAVGVVVAASLLGALVTLGCRPARDRRALRRGAKLAPDTRCTLIAGTARDITKTWGRASKSLDIIFDAVGEYQCVVIESNSSDDTLAVLNRWAAKDATRRHVVSLGTVDIKKRTARIAACRNAYMDYFTREQMWDNAEHLMVLDIDNVLSVDRNFKDQLQTCFERDDWDGVASNRRGLYYDIWALRSRALGCTFDCWEMVFKIDKQGTEKERVAKYVTAFKKHIPPTDPWIPCESAFGAMAIYKTAAVRERRYNGNKTCEHVPFNEGLHMFINPALISGS